MRVLRVRTAGLLGWLCFTLAAQPPGPESSLVHGVVLERDPEAAGGEFSVRLEDSQVLLYRFDDKTLVDRDRYPINVPRLRPGEKVEVLSDRVAGSLLRYARTIHVVLPALVAAHPPRRRTAVSLGAVPLADEGPLWRPSLSLFGVVGHLTRDRLLLHTRDGDRTVLLLPDTRYFENGDIVDAGSLGPNMRVFIQAGKNLYDEIEGYRVIWGKILAPAPPNW